MNLYDCIWKRKAVRAYDPKPLEDAQLEEIKQFAENAKPLYENIKIDFQIKSSVKNIKPVKAPHYLLISSEKKDGDFENVGFIFQQVSLFLSSLGLGSCWIGMAKPSGELSTQLPFVITIAFGRATENPYRTMNEFKRKDLPAISSGNDERIEAARVAPSAMNNQNWFFEADNGKINVYRKKGFIGMLDKMNRVDIGIALCHLYIATEHSGNDFIFTEEKGRVKKGFIYTGTIK